MQDDQQHQQDDAVQLTTAWLSNPNTRADAVATVSFLAEMRRALEQTAVAEPPSSTKEQYEPAVTARKSLASRDVIISMIDGKPYKTLRRHLTSHGITPDEYRRRYGLKADYPMVAPNYSEHRRAMAHKIGLGSKGRTARATKAEAKGTAEPKRPRRAPKKDANDEAKSSG